MSYGLTYDQRPLAKSRNFFDMFPTAESLAVPLGNIQYRKSNMNPFELYCVCCIAMLVRPQRLFEIGTFDGATALQFARICPQSQIFTLDLGPAESAAASPEMVDTEVQNVRLGGVGSRFHGAPEASRISQLLGDSTRFDYTPYLGSMDLVFVDACHDYDFVRSDTLNALRLIRPGGVVIWHDYEGGWPGVIRAVDSLAGSHTIEHISGTALAVLRSSNARSD